MMTGLDESIIEYYKSSVKFVDEMENALPPCEERNEIHEMKISMQKLLDGIILMNKKAIDGSLTKNDLIGFINYMDEYCMETPMMIESSDAIHEMINALKD